MVFYYIITVLWQLTIVSSWLFLILCNPWHGLSDTLNWDWDLLPAWWVPWSAPRLQLVSALGTPGPPSGNGVTLARNHEEINPIRDAEPLSDALLSEIPVLAETSILVSDFYEKKKIRRRKRWYCRICFFIRKDRGLPFVAAHPVLSKQNPNPDLWMVGTACW